MAVNETKKEYHKKWYEKNKERRLAQIRQYHKDNREITYRSFKKYFINYQRERRQYDKRFVLDQNMLRTIRRTLKNVKKPREKVWIEKLGYKITDLKKHLQNRIPQGYKWKDYIDGKLQLDHIIPRYLFIYESTDNPFFKKCWAMKNLRLLPARKNKLNYFTGIRNVKQGVSA